VKSCISCKFYHEFSREQKRGTCKVEKSLQVGDHGTWPVKTHYGVCEKHGDRRPWYCPACDALTLNRYCECGAIMDRRNRWGPRKAKTWGYPEMIIAKIDDEWEITKE